jgi:hypothetical protein
VSGAGIEVGSGDRRGESPHQEIELKSGSLIDIILHTAPPQVGVQDYR